MLDKPEETRQLEAALPRGVRDLFLQSEAAEPVQAGRATVLRAGLSRPIHVSGYDRKVGDFYATPDWVTEALLRHVRFRGRVWEPCCGAGAISIVMQRRGYDVTSTDIADRGYGAAGVDFLSCQAMPDGCRAIVTNPPMATPDRSKAKRSPPWRCSASCVTRCA